MFNLQVVQAAFGDCLLLEFGSAAQPRYILIDGGPGGTYQQALRPYLAQLAAQGRRIELAMLSHVDNDHIVGLLDLVKELRQQRDTGQSPLIEIAQFWINSFRPPVARPQLRPFDPNAPVVATPGPATAPRPRQDELHWLIEGFREGVELDIGLKLLGIPINQGFSQGQLVVDTASPITFDNLTLQLVGPTRANLDKLREEWKRWYQQRQQDLAAGLPAADRSVPNLSSICVLAEADGRRVLLTGDARGDHIVDGLKQAGLLAPDGTLHVDVLKMPHHGSARNIRPAFIKAITADTYVISANGRNNNPDRTCLGWLIEAARDAERTITIALTNATPTTEQIIEDYPPAEYGYRMVVLPPDQPLLTLELA